MEFDTPPEKIVESQETDKEIIEKIVSELTEKLESDVESLREKVENREEMGRDEETGEIKLSSMTDVEFKRELLSEEEEKLRRRKDEMRGELESFLSMDEEGKIRFKQFLEKRKQEAEAQGEEFSGLYERRLRMIEMSEEAKKESKVEQE